MGALLALASCSLSLDRVLDGSADQSNAADSVPDQPADAAVDSGDATFTYEWKTSDWGGCSADCGGGTQVRDVVCERDDGEPVADTLCAGSKPSGQQECNTKPCKISGENCEACPYGYTQQSGACLDKFACNLQPTQKGRYFYEGAWHEGCAICNLGGPIKWEIEDK